MALTVAASGCGGGEEAADTDAPAGGGGEPVASVEVSETEFALEPENPTVEQSGLVEFVATNHGQIDHSLEVEGPEEVETEIIGPGESASVQAKLPPGEYKMYCPVGDHEDRGMVGTVTVAGGGGGGSGETEDEGSEAENESETETESESEAGDDPGGSSPY